MIILYKLYILITNCNTIIFINCNIIELIVYCEIIDVLSRTIWSAREDSNVATQFEE